MINLFGLLPKPSQPEPTVSPAEGKEKGIDIHAGMSETSRMLFLRRGMVDPARITAKPFAAATGASWCESPRRTWAFCGNLISVGW